MNWPRIRGHEAIVHSFDAAWRKGRLGHAYLFVGPAGVGKHTLARELARACGAQVIARRHLRSASFALVVNATPVGMHPNERVSPLAGGELNTRDDPCDFAGFVGWLQRRLYN